MKPKVIKHGNHIINNDYDGYMYNFNTSRGYNFNSHLHKCFEFIHIIKGHLIYTVEGTEYMLSEGDLIMTNPNELHAFSFPDKCEYQREFLHIYPGFVKHFPELVNALMARKPGYFNRISAEIVTKYGIDTIFRGIEQCCANIDSETDILVLAYSIQLMARIKQILRTEAPEHQHIVTNKKANEVCEYVDKHYDEDLSIESVASALYVSPSYVSRVFKAETGMTVKTYINMRRITHAKNLIMEGRQITNVFLECGFGDYSTFYRAFMKYVGMSPDDFKKSHNDKH